MLVHQLVISSFAVPGVERVVSDHGQALVWNGGLVLNDVVEILIMTPREHDVVKSTSRGVDTSLGAVDRVLKILVVLEGLCSKDDPVIEGAANRERITDNVPLSLSAVEEEKLAKVMNETNELHPARLAIFAKSFSSLKQMRHLRLLSVWVALVDKGVELLHGIPDTHIGTGLVVEFVSSLEVKGNSLESVLLGVEFLYAILCFIELSEGGLVLCMAKLRGIIKTALLLALEHVDLIDVVRDSLNVGRGCCDGGGHVC